MITHLGKWANFDHHGNEWYIEVGKELLILYLHNFTVSSDLICTHVFSNLFYVLKLKLFSNFTIFKKKILLFFEVGWGNWRWFISYLVMHIFNNNLHLKLVLIRIVS
jgi:hypothetical protein